MANYKNKLTFSLGAAQSHQQTQRKQSITLPSLDSKRRLDMETFRYDCPRCQKQNRNCDLCGGRTWFMVEEVLTTEDCK